MCSQIQQRQGFGRIWIDDDHYEVVEKERGTICKGQPYEEDSQSGKKAKYEIAESCNGECILAQLDWHVRDLRAPCFVGKQWRAESLRL